MRPARFFLSFIALYFSKRMPITRQSHPVLPTHLLYNQACVQAEIDFPLMASLGVYSLLQRQTTYIYRLDPCQSKPILNISGRKSSLSKLAFISTKGSSYLIENSISFRTTRSSTVHSSISANRNKLSMDGIACFFLSWAAALHL